MDLKEKIIEFVKNIPEIEIVFLFEDEMNDVLIYLNKEINIEKYDEIYTFLDEMNIMCFASVNSKMHLDIIYILRSRYEKITRNKL